MSLKNKLKRLKSHISSCEDAPPKANFLQTNSITIPNLDRWKEVNVSPYFFDGNYCLIREVTYPLTQGHGNYHFQDILTAVKLWNSRKVNHPLSADGHRTEDLFFFDTETTGLGGGVGNTIFLLGYARILNNQVVLRQHILPHPGAEIPLYQSFLENVDYKTLVTYNGKSFDWPQVKTRHTLVREHVPKLPEFGHFDLYHASKRLWKHKLERLKLTVVEKEILGIERMDDIPGFLAPMIYFDFVESKIPDGMIGILRHNENDILSLITLYTHLSFQLCGTDSHQTRGESYEVGRWFENLGEKEESERRFSKLIEGTDKPAAQARLALAFQYKKEHDWEKAFEFFKEIVDESEDGNIKMDACIEIAKILEHKQKDYSLALKYVQIAERLLIGAEIKIRKEQKILNRIARLRRKQNNLLNH